MVYLYLDDVAPEGIDSERTKRAIQAYGRMVLTTKLVRKDILALPPDDTISIGLQDPGRAMYHIFNGYKECWESHLLWTVWIEEKLLRTNETGPGMLDTGVMGLGRKWKVLTQRQRLWIDS